MTCFRLIALTLLGTVVAVAAPSQARLELLGVGGAAAQSIAPVDPHNRPSVAQSSAAVIIKDRRRESGGRPTVRNRERSRSLSRPGFAVPPRRETRFVVGEVVLSTEPNVSVETLTAIARRNRLTRMESQDAILTGLRFYRWRIDTGATVATTIRSLVRENLIVSAQPNYIYRLWEGPAIQPLNQQSQYALDMLRVPQAHRLATGNRVLVAVIDSEIDGLHPDLDGSIAATFNTTATQVPPHRHGTGMAGAIASHHRLIGTAPKASLLAIRAFGGTEAGEDGTTFRILKGLNWAASQNARVVNMSFAGPQDPALHRALEAAYNRGMVLVAAVGNAGPNSPPLYPAAEPTVIAVTAVDAEGDLFAQANRGKHVAIAAPGVDVLVPAPDGAYWLTSGTSVAAAEVSGVVALMLERTPSLSPNDIRNILMRTAKRVGTKERNPEYGAGIVDALLAVQTTLSVGPAAPTP